MHLIFLVTSCPTTLINERRRRLGLALRDVDAVDRELVEQVCVCVKGD